MPLSREKLKKRGWIFGVIYKKMRFMDLVLAYKTKKIQQSVKNRKKIPFRAESFLSL